jgi:hypothetical protein
MKGTKMGKNRIIFAICFFGMGFWISGCEPGKITASPTATLSQTGSQTPQSGLVIHGMVHLENGQGLANAKIYRALASYGGVLAAVTDSTGHYESNFQFIPGDEMISVWAELPGYTLEPIEGGSNQGKFFWRHYRGYEDRELNFFGRPSSE